MQQLALRGLADYVKIDLSIVRGLAYYTGVVFEIFDRKAELRAIAGGGRYDKLIGQLSDGAVNLPAIGFAMGDVVLGDLIRNTPAAAERMAEKVRSASALDLYLIIAKEERRSDALGHLQQLRDAGWRVDYPLAPMKVGKQFQSAESLGAKATLLYGDEWPQVKLKTLATRAETLVPHEKIASYLQARAGELRGSLARLRRRRTSAQTNTPPLAAMYRTHHCNALRAAAYRRAGHARRLGPFAARSRRRHLHRSARPRRTDAGRLPPGGTSRGHASARTRCAARM